MSDHETHDDHGHGHGPAFLAHHFDTPEQQFEAGKLGMWLFLVTEVMMFGGLFCAYALYRANHPDIFVYAHGFLDWKLGGINTAILLASSFTMAMAVRAAQLGQQKALILLLVLTLGGGFGFLIIKYFEYTSKFGHNLWPGTWNLYYPTDTGSESRSNHLPMIVEGEEEEQVISRELQLQQIAFVEFETLALHHGYTPWPPDMAYELYVDHGTFDELEHHDHEAGTRHHADAMQMFADAGVPQAIAWMDENAEGHDAHGHAPSEDATAATAPAFVADEAIDITTSIPVDSARAGVSLISSPAQGTTGLVDAQAHRVEVADMYGSGHEAHASPPLGMPDFSHKKFYIPYELQEKAVQDRVHIFFQIYYYATGLHALHVIIGMGCITWVLGKSLTGAFSPEYNVPVDIVGLYWHIVDLIWIFLFPLLYLIH